MKCLLDMDGVLADFVGGALKIHGKPSPYDKTKGDAAWDISGLIGVPDEEFWAPFDEEFWAGLEPTPECHYILDVVNRVFGVENVAILSSPSSNRGCDPGKKRWIAKHVPQFKRRYLFGPAKEFAASSERVLIDDRGQNVKDFLAVGGRAFLVPRPWNANWALEPLLIEYLVDYLDRVLAR